MIPKFIQLGGTDINQDWYNMDIHYSMLSDYNRMLSYWNFIRKNKFLKDKICCDLGAGTGILSLFALLAGVKHLYIIENQKNMIEIINKLLTENGISKEKYTILQGWSTDVTLPEKVDAIIHELIGMWGNAEQCLGYVVDFRDRFLKEDGKIIPDIVEVNLRLQYNNVYYDPIYGSNFDFMDDKININSLFNKDNEYSKLVDNYDNTILSIIDNDINYSDNTCNCNINTLVYDLQNESLEETKNKVLKLNFLPKSDKIIALLSTIKYYCSDNPTIIGDSAKYNTNWRKQILLFKPVTINNGDIITGELNMSDLEDSTTEQLIKIKLLKNKKLFFDKKFRSLTDNLWEFNFVPYGVYNLNESLDIMKKDVTFNEISKKYNKYKKKYLLEKKNNLKEGIR